MGNHTVYGEGHFITPNKVRRPNHLDENALNMENLFGKINIEAAKEYKDLENKPQELQKSLIQYIQHFQKLQEIRINEPSLNGILKQRINECKEQQQIHQHIIIDRKIKSQMARSPIESKIDISKFMSRQDSPIKQQNKKPQQSRIQIFQSRIQSKYFKISK